MKNNTSFLLALFSLIASQASAQYASTFSSNPVWLGRMYGWGAQDFVTTIGGDSIINDIAYKKLYTQYDGAQEAYLQSLLREDLSEGKVYCYQQEGEVLIYDYSLEAGESTTIYAMGYPLEITIQSVEIIEVDNTQRRKLNFDDAGRVAFWIEGVGSCYSVGDAALGFSVDYDPILFCFYQNSALHWTSFPDSFQCEDVLSVENNKVPYLVAVYPNPALDEINIRLNGNFSNAVLTITSITGKLIRQQNIAAFNGMKQLNIADLESGVYFLSIAHSNNERTTKRIVKL